MAQVGNPNWWRRGELYFLYNYLTEQSFDYHKMSAAPKVAHKLYCFSRTVSDYAGHRNQYRDSIRSLRDLHRHNLSSVKIYGSVDR